MADRQRGVLVGARCQRFVHEQVTRHGADGVEHALVDDAGFAQAVDQTVAHALRGHADAHRFGLQSQARGHASPSPASSMAAVSPPTQPATFSSAW